MKYRRIRLEERKKIFRLRYLKHLAMKQIGEKLGRDKSSISRELKRGTKNRIHNPPAGEAHKRNMRKPQCPKLKITDEIREPAKPKREKSNGTQNYLCKNCRLQFIADHEKTYWGCLSSIAEFVKIMLARGAGIRDTSAVLKISVTKVLKIITSGVYTVQPKKKHYDCLEIDEFWTYVGEKKNKVRLIYACHRETGEIVGYDGENGT